MRVTNSSDLVHPADDGGHIDEWVTQPAFTKLALQTLDLALPECAEALGCIVPHQEFSAAKVIASSLPFVWSSVLNALNSALCPKHPRLAFDSVAIAGSDPRVTPV